MLKDSEKENAKAIGYYRNYAYIFILMKVNSD